MNDKDSNTLLEFLNKILEKNPYIYVDEKKQFYFDSGLNMQIRMCGTSQHCEVQFVKFFSNDKEEYTSMSIEFEKIKPFMEKVYNSYVKNKNNEYFFKDYDPDIINEEIKYVKNYLKTHTFSTKGLTYLSEAVISIPENEFPHLLRVGQALSGLSKEKKEINLLSIVEMPLTVQFGKTKDEYQQLNFILPGWELHEYKSFDNFFKVNNATTSIHQLAQDLKNISPEAGLLLNYTIIETAVGPENNTTIKKHKI